MKRSIPVLVVLCMLLTTSMVHAQKRYKKLPGVKGNIRSLNGNVKRMLSGKADADEQILTDYFRNYICFSLTDLSQGSEFGARRVALKKSLSSAKSEAVRKKAVEILSSTTLTIARSSSYHPMARFNALLIAGDLNKVESVNGKPPVPLKSVFDRMIVYLSPKAPDEVRMACLIGLMRHAELGTHPDSPSPLSPADRTKLAGAVLKIFQQTTPTKKNTEDVNNWMRRRAADVLGRAGDAGPNGVVAKALYNAMLSEEESTGLRCACAEALGRMDLSKASISAKKLGAALGQLAANCSQEEVAMIVEKLSQSGGRGVEFRGGGGYGRGEFGGDEEDEFQDPTTLPARRRLFRKLNQVLFALGEGNAPAGKGIMSIAEGPAVAESMVEDVNALVEHLQDVDSDLRGLGVAIREEAQSLADSVSGDLDAPAAPAAEPAAAG